MKTVLLFAAFIIAQITLAQELKELRHTRDDFYKCDFYVSFSDKEVKYEDTLHYHWFKSQQIHITQGNSSGRVLNGAYTKFYHSGQMAEQGEFKKGLKDGLWKTWFESGNLRTIYNYKEGITSGDYLLFNESGDLRESGKIKKGEKKVDETDEEKADKKDKPVSLKKAYKMEQKRMKKDAKRKERDEKKAERNQDKPAKEGTIIERIKIKINTIKANSEQKKKDRKSKKEKKDRD